MDKINLKDTTEIPSGKKIDCMFLGYIFCIISAILYSITESALLGLLSTVVICGFVCFLRNEDSYILVFGLQFLRVTIPVQIGESAFGFIIFVYMFWILKMILRNEKVLLEYLVLAFLLFLDIMTSAISGIFKIGDNINWICSLMYMVYILKFKADKIDFEKLFLYFLIAQWAVCIINILAEYRIFGQSLVSDMYGVFTEELGHFAFGKAYPTVAGGNGIAFNNSFAIGLCILMFYQTKRFSMRIFYIASIVFLGYCGIFVIARGFYVEIALFVVLLLISNMNKPGKMMFSLIMLAIFAYVFYKYLYSDLASSFDRVLDRFEAGNQNREDLIEQTKILLRQDVSVLLFGAGSYYPDIYGFTAHNIYWDSIISLGVVGGMAYWIIIVRNIISCVKKHVVFAVKPFIPMIMLFVYKTISGSVRDVGFYYYIAMSVIFAIYITRGQKDGKAADDIHANIQ